MAIQIKGDGTLSIEYEGPYAGLDVEKPETLISDKASPSFNNFMLRNAELRSRPNFFLLFNGVSGGLLGGPPVGISSFLDINGVYHTVMWAGVNLGNYNPALLPGNPFVAMVGAPGNMSTNPVSHRAFANQIWYTSIGTIAGHYTPHPDTGGGGGGGTGPTIDPFLAYWDGIAAAPVFTQTFGDGSTSQSVAGISLTDSPTVGGSLPGAPTITGPIAIGGAFLSELDNYLILANVTIKDQGTGAIYNYPNLIWWCANGLPLQWDPTQNTSAGFNPFLDVGDQITGLAMIGVAGYIFRTWGITEVTPTGSAVTPFEFDHLWASERGIGNVFPFTIAQYGGQCAFVAADNIYIITLSGINAIGGTARYAIYADLAAAAYVPFACIVPYFTSGYIYLTYQIWIPFATFVRVYVYSFDDKNWEPWDLDLPQIAPGFQQLTCAPNVV